MLSGSVDTKDAFQDPLELDREREERHTRRVAQRCGGGGAAAQSCTGVSPEQSCPKDGVQLVPHPQRAADVRAFMLAPGPSKQPDPMHLEQGLVR